MIKPKSSSWYFNMQWKLALETWSVVMEHSGLNMLIVNLTPTHTPKLPHQWCKNICVLDWGCVLLEGFVLRTVLFKQKMLWLYTTKAPTPMSSDEE